MRYIFIFLAAILHLQAFGQLSSGDTKFNVKEADIRPLKKGDLVPDVLFISKENFPDNVKSLHDYKGKLVLLDFWSTGCSSCIAAFPKMDKFQKKYGDRLQIVLVNPYETAELVHQRWTRIATRSAIVYPDIPRVSGDSIWKKLFPTTSVPHHVWLNEEGKIIAVTGGHNASEATIEALLKGEKKRLLLKPAVDRMDLSQKSFIETISEGRVLPGMGANFYSYYEGEGASIYGTENINVVDTMANTLRFTYVNISPLIMAKKLFTQVAASPGTNKFLFDDRTFVETSNPAPFQNRIPNEQLDQWILQHRFGMEVVVPLEKKDSIYHFIFDQFRHYIKEKYNQQISIEERRKPCLVMVQKPGTSLLRTKGGEKKQIFPKDYAKDKMMYLNTPFEEVFKDLDYQINSDREKRYTVVNEVPYKGNVDISFMNIYGKPHQLDMLKKQLNEYGLDLIEADRKVTVFVVRDL